MNNFIKIFFCALIICLATTDKNLHGAFRTVPAGKRPPATTMAARAALARAADKTTPTASDTDLEAALAASRAEADRELKRALEASRLLAQQTAARATEQTASDTALEAPLAASCAEADRELKKPFTADEDDDEVLQRAISESLATKAVEATNRSLPSDIIGLQNRGNWCYFNSCVQAFFSNPTLNAHLIPMTPMASSWDPVVKALKDMHTSIKSAEKDPAAIKALHEIFFTTAKDKFFLGSDSQQDASELSTKLLDRLNRVRRVPSGNSTKNYTCPICETKRKGPSEEFKELIIPYTREHSTLQTEIARYNNPETIDVRCPTCGYNGPQESITQFSPHRELLIVRLTREDKTSRNKNRNPIQIEERIRIEDKTYTLSGMILHRGTSIRGGHYIAIVRSNSGRWVIADDSHISDGTAAQAAIARGEKYKDFDVTMAFYSGSNSTAAGEGGASGAQYAGAGSGAGSC